MVQYMQKKSHPAPPKDKTNEQTNKNQKKEKPKKLE